MPTMLERLRAADVAGRMRIQMELNEIYRGIKEDTHEFDLREIRDLVDWFHKNTTVDVPYVLRQPWLVGIVSTYEEAIMNLERWLATPFSLSTEHVLDILAELENVVDPDLDECECTWDGEDALVSVSEGVIGVYKWDDEGTCHLLKSL